MRRASASTDMVDAGGNAISTIMLRGRSRRVSGQTDAPPVCGQRSLPSHQTGCRPAVRSSGGPVIPASTGNTSNPSQSRIVITVHPRRRGEQHSLPLFLLHLSKCQRTIGRADLDVACGASSRPCANARPAVAPLVSRICWPGPSRSAWSEPPRQRSGWGWSCDTTTTDDAAVAERRRDYPGSGLPTNVTSLRGLTAAIPPAPRRSLIITCNQPFSEWHRIFPDAAMTADRLVHHATRSRHMVMREYHHHSIFRGRSEGTRNGPPMP